MHQKKNINLDLNLLKKNDFKELKVGFCYKLPSIKVEIFMEDVFTEPFPSTHDMDTWALVTQISDIFILKGIDMKESGNYIIYIKNHFVNHIMVQGIIHFDIFKKVE
jgi:hypothetical protein